jgi:hypothetical protein
VNTLLAGECPARRRRCRDSQKSNKPSKPPETYENVEKTGGFTHLLAYKSPAENTIFRSKVLNKILSRAFFEKYINFSLLKPLRSYACPKTRKSYTPPAAWIKVKRIRNYKFNLIFKGEFK